MAGIRDFRVVAYAVCTLLAMPAAVEPAAAQDPGLRIVVIEGEDSVNIIAQGTAVPTLVEVRDRNDLPVSGATVLFLLGEGGTATLNAGLQQVTLTTNALGQAAVTVNPVASGTVQLTVNATFQGQTATAALVQTNFATVAEAAAAGAGTTGGGGGAVGGTAAGGGGGAVGGTAAGGTGGGGLGTGAVVGIVAAGGAAAGVAVARAGGGESSSTPAPPATTPPTPTVLAPSAPPAPTVTPGDGQLEVRWTAPSDNGAAIDDYDVRYRPVGGNWQELPDAVKSTATSATITGLANGTEFQVQVRAENAVGDGPWSASATGTPVAAFDNDDKAALVDLYNATNGANWTNSTNWNTSEPLDTWHGVSTDGNGRVTGLDLSGNQLAGSIPASLGNLTNLQVVALGGNQLTGSIPASLGSLTNLEWLNLSNNRLTGSIPASLSSLANLESLFFDRNQLTGSIPASLGSLANLEWLDLSINRLTGSIPASFGNLANLEGLLLYRNQFTGSIPASLGSLANLGWLNLHRNQFTGSIPASLGSLTNLQSLFLSDNQLTGSIPASLGSLTNLEQLYLSINQLTGSIPASLGNLANLQELWLQQNRLTGSIPAALCRFYTSINPQQGDVNLPCAQSSAASGQNQVALSVSDARAEEAAGAAVAFAVTLSRAASDPVTVRYATRDGSARAGEDYAAASGTLTFEAGETSKTVAVEVLDDAHDESEETFVLALSNVAGARLEDAEATGTIENTDLLPAALLARLGRATAQHVVEHVEARMAQPREPGFRARFAGRDVAPGMERELALDFLSQFGQPAGTGPLGGSAMTSHASGARMGLPSMAGQDPRMGGAASLQGHGASSAPGGGFLGSAFPGGDFLGSALPGGDLLSGSEFELNREQHGGVISVWSRSARSHFGGRQGALSLDGDVRTTMLGADYTRGRLVAGLSLARSQGLGGYGGRHAGRVESSVTGLYPWLGYRVNDRVSVWGVTGYGAGAMRLTPERATALESGLSMALAAAGTRGELVGSRAGGGFALAFTADALWVGTSVDGVDGAAGRLSAAEAAVTRVRTGIEGSRGFTFGGRMSLTPSVEVGLRQDGGDAETGTGVDVVGGLAFTDASTGLSLDVQVRTLVAHQAEGFTERGMSLSLGWDPTPSSPLGLTARVAPSWGGPEQGSEALWGGGPLSRFGSYGGRASAGRVDAELGYGLPVGRRLVGTPRVGFGTSAYGRTYQLGYSLGALETEKMDLELGVEAQRRERPMRHGSDLGVLGRARVRW